jgi:prepilin signal peptidase PulO-like enzyme (type II secretory pathway)
VLGLGLLIENYFLMLFFPFLFSILFEVIARIIKKNKRKEDFFAFGPYIILGFYFIMLYWENPIHIV